MTHALGDDRKGNAFGFGGGSPAVAGYVECEGDGDVEDFCYLFEPTVDVVSDVAVCPALVDAGVAYDGE